MCLRLLLWIPRSVCKGRGLWEEHIIKVPRGETGGTFVSNTGDAPGSPALLSRCLTPLKEWLWPPPTSGTLPVTSVHFTAGSSWSSPLPPAGPLLALTPLLGVPACHLLWISSPSSIVPECCPSSHGCPAVGEHPSCLGHRNADRNWEGVSQFY